MGIMLRSYIDLLNIKEEDYVKAFKLVSAYIEKSDLMSFSRRYQSEGLYILEKATLINNVDKKEKYFNIIGDYVTKSTAENFIIYEKLYSYLNNGQRNLFELIREKTSDEKARVIDGEGISNESIIVSMWNSKTQGQPYLIDLIKDFSIIEELFDKYGTEETKKLLKD